MSQFIFIQVRSFGFLLIDKKFVCLDSAGVVSWGILDENPNVKQTMHLATGGTGTYTASADAFPFWAPDSVHIIYTRKDGGNSWCDIFSLNTATGQEIRLTKDFPIHYDASYFLATMHDVPRTIFNDGRCSSYHYVDQGMTAHDLYITVSLDGKVAYYNRNKASLDMVLLNGTGQKDRCCGHLYSCY